MEKTKEIDNVKFTSPTVITLPTDKIADFLVGNSRLDAEKIFECKARIKKDGKRSAQTEIYSSITLKIADNGTFDYIDKIIILALGTLQNAGNEYISLRQLYKTLGGNDRYLTKTARKFLLERIDKLRLSDFRIDMTEYLETCTPDKPKKLACRKKTYLLPCEVIEMKINGKTTKDGIKLLAPIPFFEIAGVKARIARQPLQLITGLGLNATENSIVLSWYLFDRVTKIVGSRDSKRAHNLNNSILFETLYKDCGFTDFSRDKKYDLRKNITKILTHFKDCGLITDFKFTDDFHSIEFQF